MKSVAFTVVLLIATVAIAKPKGKTKPSALATPQLKDSTANIPKIKQQKIRAKIRAEKIKKSNSDLSSAISESYEGRKEIQKEVQNAAGIEKATFEPSREQFRVEVSSSSVSSAPDDSPEPAFVPPRRGPASVDTKGLLKEVAESEKDSD